MGLEIASVIGVWRPQASHRAWLVEVLFEVGRSALGPPRRIVCWGAPLVQANWIVPAVS